MRQWFSVLMGFLFSVNVVFAASISCSPAVVKVEGRNIILPGPTQEKGNQIYFFQNISKQSLWLDHPVEHPSASAGWSSYVRPGNWSSLVVNRKNFAINCAVIKPGKVDYQDCSKVVAICSPQHLVFESKRKGTYWLAEDKSWDALVVNLVKKK